MTEETSNEEVTERGPWDAATAPDDGVMRVDFGSLQIPGIEGMDINIEVDETSQAVVAITVVIGQAAIQIQPFAAPRSAGFWDEVRKELADGILESGGVVEEGESALGADLRATVPMQGEDGEELTQQVRFVGFEGDRWLLRGVLLGQAAVEAGAAKIFEEVFSGCIVSRGTDPMAPGELLTLSLPDGAVPVEGEAAEAAEQQRPPLDPFERGPEITEIR